MGEFEEDTAGEQLDQDEDMDTSVSEYRYHELDE